jgi:acetoin utilization protein AcuB
MRRSLHVGRFMTGTPLCCRPDDPLEPVRERMLARDIHHLPVVDGGEIVGIISAADIDTLHRCPHADLSRAVVAEAMSPAPYVVSMTTPVAEVVRTMAAHRWGAAVVVDRKRRVRGIFTTGDALRLLAALTVSRRDQSAAPS